MENKLICQICKKEFSSTSTRNRHVRDFHTEVEQQTRKKRIMCPMCPNTQVFSFHANLLSHLTDNHQVQISESVMYFSNFEDFTIWKSMVNNEFNYACDVKRKNPNGEQDIVYNCNRSDSRGFVSMSTKRSMRTGGSIRMRGMCPSRMKVKILKDGSVTVIFTETHLGHDELPSKKLSKQVIQENSKTQDGETSPSLNEMREIGLTEISDFSRTLDKLEFQNLMAVFTMFKNDITKKREQKRISKKRKIEKQTIQTK